MIRILVFLLFCFWSFPVMAQERFASEIDPDLPSKVSREDPTFPGGHEAMVEFIKEELEYPCFARFFNIEGDVLVEFVVEKDGELTKIGVSNDVNWSLKREAIRVVEEMPRWEPGREDGEKVPVNVKIPIRFQLN